MYNPKQMQSVYVTPVGFTCTCGTATHHQQHSTATKGAEAHAAAHHRKSQIIQMTEKKVDNG